VSTRPKRAIRRAQIAALSLLLLAGCAQLPQDRGDGAPGSLERVELAQVPFIAQEDQQCGPASLAMVLQAAGRKVTAEELSPQVYLPGREGSLQVEMLAATRRQGLVAYPIEGGLKALYAEVAAGNPVVVLQNLGLSWLPVWHYAVVIGFDGGLGEILLHSGTTPRMGMSTAVFARTWKRSEEWAMLALPPDLLPATAMPERYIRAVVALEKTGQTGAAHRAYATAAKAWPDNLVAWMGLGNTAYALKDLARAERAFREASIRHPESAEAFNNLAHVLADQRRYREAMVAARKAVSLGGPHAAASRNTLESISAKTRSR
jgi:tetratricopeptide (TPR) repeat protein